MARQVKLTAEQVEDLHSATVSTVRRTVWTALLESRGLVRTGYSRFGGWMKATDAGRRYVDMMSANRGIKAAPSGSSADTEASTSPATAPGPTDSSAVGRSLGGSAPPKRRKAEKEALPAARPGSKPVITPPAGALDVGETTSMRRLRTRAAHKRSTR